VVVLNSSQDGLQQIANYLALHSGTTTAEILAHGNAGELWLGSSYLSTANLSTHAESLARIGNGLVAGGDILIYACNTAEGGGAAIC
jgi:hypothetical protein